MLPDRGWQSYEDALCRLGERRPPARGDEPLLAFLATVGLLDDDRASLSAAGQDYFNALFVKGDMAAADSVLHGSVLAHPPATAVTQLLAGVPGADRARVETVLRSQGFAVGSERGSGRS